MRATTVHRPQKTQSAPLLENEDVHSRSLLHQAQTEAQAALQRAREAQEELSAIICALGDIVFELDEAGRYSKIFSMGRSLLFRPPAEVIGQSLHDVLPKSVADACLEAIKVALQSGQLQCLEYVLPFEDGEKVFEASVSPLSSDTVVCVARDVTEQHRARAELQRVEARYRSLFENAVEGIFRTTLEGRYVDANPALARLYGYDSPADLIASVHDIGQQLYVDQERRAEFQRLMEEHGQVEGFESQIYRKDGGIIWLSENARAVRDASGKIAQYEGFIENITARKEAENRLRHDALHDRLTGLPNRALFMDRLQQAMGRAQRHEEEFYAVLFLDMDRFKVVNDSLGHMAGDRLLIEMARRLERALRPGDTVARLGGDEFAVLLEEITSSQDATQIAERVHQELNQVYHLNDQAVSTSASIGIAMGDRRYQRPEELLRDADMAMYRAKVAGKARHELFDAEMYDHAVAALKLESDLRLALERSEFHLAYQPIISLKDERLVGFEALLRWEHPEQRAVPPSAFIPLAEETGLIVPIGLWVLREACRQLKDWHDVLPDDQVRPTMSVNLSVKQFSQPGLDRQILEALHQADLAPEYLKLEITESALMGDAEDTAALLARLRDMGVRLGLDDFGTGYSSLSYLHRFALDTLKIDRSFIAGIDEEDRNQEIVRAIVALAASLRLDVVAEGVETASQLDQLRHLHCKHAQGYLFSHPTNSEGALKLLTEGHLVAELGI